jgi:hypothetical protein
MVHLALLVMMLNFGIDHKVSHTIDSLHKEGVDTIMIFAPGCGGRIGTPDTCTWDLPKYITWVQKGQYFLKKVTICGQPQTALLTTDNPLSWYLAHQNEILQEEIKEPISKMINGTYLTTSVSHVNYYDFTMLIGDSTYEKHVNEYNLHLKSFDGKTKNINYYYNQHTRLKALLDSWMKIITRNGTIQPYDAYFMN